MKTRLLKIFSLVLALWAIRLSGAPMGTAFTYQGRLYDGNVPASGEYVFRFGLFDSLEGGVNLGTFPPDDAPLVVPVINGLFTATIDFGPAAFRGNARFLQVAVRTNDPGITLMTPLLPRQELKPAPYALFAGSAAGVSPESIDNAALAEEAVTGPKIADRTVVRSVNGLTDVLTIAAGPNISLSAVGSTLTISGAGDGAPAWLLSGNGGTDPIMNFLGTTDNTTLTMRVNNQPALRLSPAIEPNVTGGGNGNRFIAGRSGTFIGGGASNVAEGTFSSIAGGLRNTTAEFAAVGGGFGNQAAGPYATVAGGVDNRAAGIRSAIGGGIGNFASGLSTTIAGGVANTNTANYASIGGGFGNSAAGQDAVVAGGSGNSATAGQSAVGGGIGNRAAGTSSAIGGGQSNTNQAHASVISGGQQNFVGTHVYDSFEFDVTNHADRAAILGGQLNLVSSRYGGIGTGSGNQVFGDYGFIGGGTGNQIGGPDNQSAGLVAGTIGGGSGNSVGGGGGTVSGGEQNEAGGQWSAIAGGLQARTASHGQFAHSAGQIARAGDAQFSLYVLRRQTQNNTQEDLRLDGSSLNLNVPFGAVWSFRLQVTAMQVNGTNFAAYEASGVIANLVTGVSPPPAVLQLRDGAGNPLTSARPIFETSGAVSWQATPYVAGGGATGGDLRIAVNGGAAQGAINWVATLQTAELLK